MIWLTWRQFRAQAITAIAGVAVFAIVYGVTGPRLAHLYAASGLACVPQWLRRTHNQLPERGRRRTRSTRL